MLKIKMIFVVGLFLMSFETSAQKRYTKSLTQMRGKQHKPMRFKKNKHLAVICPIFIPSEYPYQGIGFKAGDPFALTYKLYATKMLAFSIDGGIGAYGLYKARYAELFNILPGSDTLTYFNHQVEKDTHISAKISFYNEGPEFLNGLDYYLSLGWQYRYVSILYGYDDEVTAAESIFGSFTRQVDYNGPEIGIGLEYAYFDLPISAFMEVTWMYDLVHQPTFIKFQGGIGLRYVF